MKPKHTSRKKSNPSNASVKERTRLFNELILPNLNLVFRFAIRFSKNPQDIEENYNECLVNLFRYIHTYDPEKNLANWVFVCCQRLIYNVESKRSLWKTSDDVNPEEIRSHYEEDGTEVSSNFMGLHNYEEYYNDDILKALVKLKPIYREALLLQQAGYRLEEIMEITHRNGSLKTPNIETVKSRLFLAKQKMRKMIDRDGNERKK